MLQAYYGYVCNRTANSSWLVELSNPAATNTTYVALDACFQASVLIWLPCFAFWALSPFWLHSLAKLKGQFRQVRVAWLLLFKTLASLALIANELAHLSYTTNYFEKSTDDHFLHYANSTILILSFVSSLSH